jgi:FKBP-type peptidyl-prolyl cis-trans isomerase (trigger factor)
VRQFGEEHINHLSIDFAIDKIYREALMKEKLVPVAQGQITEIVTESPLVIKIQVEILPEVEMDDKYKKISLKKKKIEVTDTEIQAALDDIQTRFTMFKEAEKNAKVEK